MTIYLSGGMRSGWQERVKFKFPQFRYFDPTKHQLYGSLNYTPWDLGAISLSDIVVCYLEKDNPSGFGLCVEVGFACALNK